MIQEEIRCKDPLRIVKKSFSSTFDGMVDAKYYANTHNLILVTTEEELRDFNKRTMSKCIAFPAQFYFTFYKL